ncbi:MAG: UbiD family decarboxylase [Desulfitobacteriaceae bacterium]
MNKTLGNLDLQACLKILDKTGRVARIESEVDLVHELAGVAYKLEGSRVALFEKVKGHSFPVVTGMFWNRGNLAELFGCTIEEFPFVIADAVTSWQENPIDPIVIDKAPVQEVVEATPNLYDLPIPTHALEDGGPYLSCCVVIAKDPDTGVRNSSVHRCMVVGPDRLTMLMDVGRHLRDCYERAEAKGQPLEITISNGLDPSVYFAAVIPSSAAPIDKDELGIACALRGGPLELSRSLTVGVEGIANAQFCIEGEILPYVREPEGKFGEVTGYYATKEDRWVVKVKAITHRKSPVFHTLIPGKEVYNSVGLTGEANIFRLVSRQIPGVKAVYLSHGGCGFYHAIVQMEPKFPGMAKNVIMATFAAFPPLQMVTVVNPDVDIYNAEEIQWAMATRFKPDEDIVLLPKSFGHELNPSTDGGLGTKIGFDCTVPMPKPSAYERLKMLDVNLNNYLIRS